MREAAGKGKERWPQVRLGDVCTITMGQSPESSSYNDRGDGLPFYQGNADFGNLHPTTRYWCSRPKKLADINDVLISVRAPIGAVNLAVEKCCIGRGLASITAKNNCSDFKYLYYALISKTNELNVKGTGSTFKAIKKTTLEETQIPLPPLPEQRRIAAVLDQVSSLIALRKAQLAKLDLLVKARFVEMFGDPVKNEMGWNRSQITKVCERIVGGGTPPKSHLEYFEGTIPWISPKDMKSCFITDSTDHITETAVQNSTTNLVPQNSVLMVIRSGILKHDLPVAINLIPVTINQDMKAFIPNEKVTAEYLMYYFKAIEKDILSGVRGVTADNIDFKSFQSRRIVVPPIELQNLYAVFVHTVEDEKRTMIQSLAKLNTTSSALIQEYFK